MNQRKLWAIGLSILGIVIILTLPLKLFAMTGQELIEQKPRMEPAGPITPCILKESQTIPNFCHPFRVDGDNYVMVLEGPSFFTPIVKIVTTPRAEYPTGYLTPEELIANAGTAL